MRTDAAIARLSELVCVAAGIKNKTTNEPFTAADLTPWTDEPELSLEDAMKQWK